MNVFFGFLFADRTGAGGPSAGESPTVGGGMSL